MSRSPRPASWPASGRTATNSPSGMWLAWPERRRDPASLQTVNDRRTLRQGSTKPIGRSAAMTSSAAIPCPVALLTGGGVVTALTQRGFVATDLAIDPAADDDLKARVAANARLDLVNGCVDFEAPDAR